MKGRTDENKHEGYLQKEEIVKGIKTEQHRKRRGVRSEEKSNNELLGGSESVVRLEKD
jgi:ABC-type xylose transport system substrate-binding protein